MRLLQYAEEEYIDSPSKKGVWPGGIPPQNVVDTLYQEQVKHVLVHEVGHLFGLKHTFGTVPLSPVRATTGWPLDLHLDQGGSVTLKYRPDPLSTKTRTLMQGNVRWHADVMFAYGSANIVAVEPLALQLLLYDLGRFQSRGFAEDTRQNVHHYRAIRLAQDPLLYAAPVTQGGN